MNDLPVEGRPELIDMISNEIDTIELVSHSNPSNERLGCIYVITNIKNNKQYVGQTIHPTPELRYEGHWRASLRTAGIPRNDNTPLHRAMRKYGKDSFKVEILCVVPLSELNTMEAKWAAELQTYVWDKPDSHPPGYNACWCGINGWLGMKHSKKSKELMSIGKKGIPLTGTHRENVIRAASKRKGVPLTGSHLLNVVQCLRERNKKIMSKLTRFRISQWHIGKKLSEATRARMRQNHSDFWKGRKHTPASIQKMKQAQLGRKQTQEHIEKKAAALRGRRQSDNQIANAREGRIKRIVETGAKGVKLNKDKVLTIIKQKEDGVPQTEIAKAFGVADSVITRILNGDRWGHVTGIVPVKKTGAPRVKLGEEKAKQIRELYSNGGVSYDSLGKQFGVNKTTIAKIVKGIFYPDK